MSYYFHWDLNTVLDLEHPVRAEFVAQINALNMRINGGD